MVTLTIKSFYRKGYTWTWWTTAMMALIWEYTRSFYWLNCNNMANYAGQLWANYHVMQNGWPLIFKTTQTYLEIPCKALQLVSASSFHWFFHIFVFWWQLLGLAKVKILCWSTSTHILDSLSHLFYFVLWKWKKNGWITGAIKKRQENVKINSNSKLIKYFQFTDSIERQEVILQCACQLIKFHSCFVDSFTVA